MIRVALAVIMLLVVVQSAIGEQLDGAFWLEQYEDLTWNPAATEYVLGVFQGAETFGGIRCPTPVSPRTLAAMTADVVKQAPRKNEPAVGYVLKAAVRLRCIVDTNLIRRAADVLEKETKR
jgi:hypothetical protein